MDCLATVVDAPITVSIRPDLQFSQGLPDNQVVATFSDPGGDETLTDYAATINWGDGTTTPGTTSYHSYRGSNQFNVTAADMHAYSDTQSRQITVTVCDQGGASDYAIGTVSVLPQQVLGWGQDYQLTGDDSDLDFDGLVATFVNPGGAGSLSDYSVQVQVNGTPVTSSQLTYDSSTNEFQVNCSCTLPDPDLDVFSVNVVEDGIEANFSSEAYTQPSGLSASEGAHATAVAGQELAMQLASFTVADPDVTPQPYYAAVSWDNGYWTDYSAEVVPSGNGYVVEGTNLYAEAGNYAVRVNIYTASGSLGTVYDTVSVSDPAISIAPATGLQADVDTQFTRTVATFTDPNTQAVSGDFIARITWENGNTSTGTVNFDDGSGTISGNYTYGQTGPQTIKVELYDVGGAEAHTTVSMQVNPGTLDVVPVPFAIDDLNAGDMVQVASLSDTDVAAVSGNYTATMNWGSASCGCLVVPADDGGFDVYGSTATPFAGSNEPITVTITDTGGASATITENAFLLDSGSMVTLDGLPDASNVTVTNGTELGLDGSTVSFSTLDLIDGSIDDGTINTTSDGTYTIQNGGISANLAGSGSFTIPSDGWVELAGTNSVLTGGVSIASCAHVLVGGTFTLAGSGNVTVDSGGSLGLEGGGTLITASGATVTNYGTFVNHAGGTVINDGTLSSGATASNWGTLVNNGTLNTGDGISNNGEIVNDNTITGAVDGAIAVQGTVLATGGSVDVSTLASADIVLTEGTTLTGSGNLDNVLIVNGGLSGSITANNVEVTGEAVVQSATSATVTGALVVESGAELDAYGLLTTNGASIVSGTFDIDGTLANAGSMITLGTTNDNGSLDNTGSLTNAGTLTDNGAIDNFAPGMTYFDGTGADNITDSDLALPADGSPNGFSVSFQINTTSSGCAFAWGTSEGAGARASTRC